MPLTGKQLLKLAIKNGWEHVRTNDSHHILEKDRKTVIIPVHANRDLGKGLEQQLLKDLGLRK